MLCFYGAKLAPTAATVVYSLWQMRKCESKIKSFGLSV